MTKFFGSIFLFGASLFFAASLFGVQNNDFTRANTTFSKRRFEESKMSDMQGRKYLDSDKKFEKKKYENRGDVSYLKDKKPPFEEGLPGKEMSKERALGNKKDFENMPEYKGKTKNDLWSGADTPLSISNTDRNLSRKYEGKIDVNKRDTKYQEYMREQYADMMEMSMREINKYYFRESHSADPGIPIATAGGSLHDNDESVWDFFSPDKKIDRGRVFVKKFKRDSTGKIVDENAPDTPVSLKEQLKTPVSPSQVPQVFKPQQTPPTRPIAYPQQAIPQNRGELKAVETVDENIGKKFDFMRVPDNLRKGAPTIKVEVKEAD